MVGMQRITVIGSMLVEKESMTNEVTITTWQSVYQLDRKFFEEYDVVIGDETPF